MIRRTWPSDHGEDERNYRRLLDKKDWQPGRDVRTWRRRFFFLCFFNIVVGIACLGKLRGWW